MGRVIHFLVCNAELPKVKVVDKANAIALFFEAFMTVTVTQLYIYKIQNKIGKSSWIVIECVLFDLCLEPFASINNEDQQRAKETCRGRMWCLVGRWAAENEGKAGL